MSQPTISSSTITDMADSISPQPSWIPLIKSAFFHQAMRKYGYISPDTNCSIIYGPEPAVFDDGQILASKHYHVDACFWNGDTFIDGATFLVPSKLPEAGSECYSVDLDEITGVHHVTLRKASLRTTLPLSYLSNPNFSSHAVEFSNGEMTVVPRVNCAVTSLKRKARKTPSSECQWDSSIAQPRPVRDNVRQIQFGSFGQDSEVDHQVADNELNLASSSVSISHEIISSGTNSAPAGSDSSITASGRVVGQQAADDRSNLSSFSESVIHIVPRNVMASNSIEAEGSDAAAQAREPVETAVDIQTSEDSSTSRRSSAGSQGSGISTSTVPTSPASSTFSTLPFWKLALANLPELPIVPGKPSYAIEALALEEPKHEDPEKIDDQENIVVRRLSWGLRISDRQLIHWDEIIQDGESPCLEELSAPRDDLVMTEEGRIVVAEDTSNNVQSSLTLPQLTSKPVEALPSFYVDKIYVSQSFDALDVVRIELVGQNYSRLFPLDLVTEAKGKQRATDAPKSQQFPPVHDEMDVDIAIDSASGELYLRPKMNAPPTVVHSISAPTGTNVATGGNVPTQDQPSSDSAGQPLRLEDIDLTAEFNQGATDLDDEEMYTAPSTIASHVIGSRLAQTQYIPPHVEYMIQAQPFVPRIVVEANEYWNFLKATIDGTWHAQGCPKGFLLRKPLHESDSDAVFRELLGLGSKPSAAVEKPQDLRIGFPVHHYNLIDQPVFQDSQNPSAVSYWAAMASYWKEQIKDGVGWKAVVSSQAAKWVDPCTLDRGVEIPDDLRARENSTALRDFITGQTTIRYGPWGTWISDKYDPNQEIPEVMTPRVREAMLSASSAANMFQGLQRPHFITPHDGMINVNDDGSATAYPSLKSKEKKEWETLETCGPTNLRVLDRGTGRAYSFKGMKESKAWEVFGKYEATDVSLFDLPFKAEPDNAVEGTSDEADADEIEYDSSEAETDISNDVVFQREPVHYQGTLQITDGSAAADSSEGGPKEVKSFESDTPEDGSQNDAVAKEDAAAEQEAVSQSNTCTSPAIEEPVEQLEEGPEVEGPTKIEPPKISEYLADTALDDGKDFKNGFKAQSHNSFSNVEDDEESDKDSVAGAGFDDTDYSSTWTKRAKPEDHPKANDLARFADVAPRLLPQPEHSSQVPEIASKSKQCQEKRSSCEAEVLSQSEQDQIDLGPDESSPFVHTEARIRLASWSSSPKRVMRGECDHTYTVDPETEEKERHPDPDWDSMDVTSDCAESFNTAYTKERTIVDPDFNEHVTNLLGSGALAQKFMSGQGIIPRTTGRIMTLLGPGAVEKMMDGHGIPRATTGMVNFLVTGAFPDVVYAPRAESDGMIILSSNSVDNTMSRRGSAPSPTDSTGTRESLSGRNLSPTKMLSSAMDQPVTLPQSPEAADNLGAWEDDGNGGFESPGKHRAQYMAKDVNGQGDQFDDEVDIFDSVTEEAPARTKFHRALLSGNANAMSMVDRATNFEDEKAPSTPMRSKVGILSPIQENSQTPVQRYREPTSKKPSWIPNFTRGVSQTRFSARKQALSFADRAAANPLPAESSKTHSRNTSSSSEAIFTENGSTHTRNTSLSNTSSSSETVWTENGSTHTRNTSLSDARLLEEEFNKERAMWEVEKRKGYAASRIAQFDSHIKVPVVLEAAALGDAPASPSMLPEAKGDVEESAEEAPAVAAQVEKDEIVENAVEASSDNSVAHSSHYLLVVAIIVAFLWPFAW